MGMFDTVLMFLQCPGCGSRNHWSAQTKDLACALHTYRPLSEDWETNTSGGRPFRSGLPVFREFPFDKAAAVWVDQAERTEAAATLPLEYQEQLNFVTVSADCPKCGRWYHGKIRVEKGRLVGGITEMVEEMVESK